VVGLVYLAMLLPVALKPPLGAMIVPRVTPWLTWWPRLSGRLTRSAAS
jgi:hypothetical protein